MKLLILCKLIIFLYLFPFSFSSLSNLLIVKLSSIKELAFQIPNKVHSMTNRIDLYAPFSRLYIFESSQKNYTIKENITFLYDSINVTATIYHEDITFKGFSLPFEFIMDLTYYNDNGEIKKASVFSGITFAYKPKFESMSLMSQLFIHKLIKRKCFAFDLSQTSSDYLYIGEIPNEIVERSSYGKCDIKDDSWSCAIKEIYFSEENDYRSQARYKGKEDKMKFDITESAIISPQEYVDFLEEGIFKELIDKGICRFNKEYKTKRIECDNHSRAFHVIPSYINILIDDMKISIPMKRLFNDNGIFLNQCYIESHSNEWIFGYHFLNLFFTVFDYKAKTILFYNNNTSLTSTHLRLDILTHIVICITVNLFGIAIQILNKY